MRYATFEVINMFAGMRDAVAKSLQLEEPWFVESIYFDEKLAEVHIHVGIRDGARFVCPRCGSEASRDGYEPTERVWRHSDCFFYKTYVHCRRPRILCPHCGAVQINAPFERKHSRFTFSYEGYAMLLLTDMPRSKVARALRCDEKSVDSILNYWIENALKEQDLKGATELAIDETSFKRLHNYVTVIINSIKSCVIDVENGRGKDTVTAFAQKLEEKGGNRDCVTSVTSDLSKTYVPAIAETFPHAVNIIDKFHVKKLFIDAMDSVRKAEQKVVRNKKELFCNRHLLMIPQSRLTEEQTSKMMSISKQYPLTGRAYRIVAALDDFYNCKTVEEAGAAFKALYSWMRRCRLEPMKKVAETLRRHEPKILAYFVFRHTNAVCEGINSMIQAAKRKARGFHTFRGFASMIYLVAGKLELGVPDPF